MRRRDAPPRCYFCNQEVPSGEIARHFDVCQQAETCEFCQGRVAIGLIRGHRALCDLAPVKKARFTETRERVICLQCNREMLFPTLGTHMAEHDPPRDSLELQICPCSICSEFYEEGERFYILKCSHMFHKSCIDTWTARHRSCPICRAGF